MTTDITGNLAGALSALVTALRSPNETRTLGPLLLNADVALAGYDAARSKEAPFRAAIDDMMDFAGARAREGNE